MPWPLGRLLLRLLLLVVKLVMLLPILSIHRWQCCTCGAHTF